MSAGRGWYERGEGAIPCPWGRYKSEVIPLHNRGHFGEGMGLRVFSEGRERGSVIMQAHSAPVCHKRGGAWPPSAFQDGSQQVPKDGQHGQQDDIRKQSPQPPPVQARRPLRPNLCPGGRADEQD